MAIPYVEAVAAHVLDRWPERSLEVLEWTIGPMPEFAPDFRVLEVAAEDEAHAWMYVSAGAAPLREETGTGHEYVLLAPRQERLLVETLAVVAYYQATGDHDGVHDGHTLNLGEPWLDDSPATFLYVNRPYFTHRDFELLPYGDGRTAHFLWLVPITEAEKDWRHEHGQEAFEQLLEAEQVNVVDPHRPAVVPTTP